jgi:hypothetical protein
MALLSVLLNDGGIPRRWRAYGLAQGGLRQREFDLRATENHGVAAAFFHSADDLPKIGDRVCCRDTVNQLTEDDAIDDSAFGRIRPHMFQPVDSELFRIDFTFDEIACCG